MTNCRASPKKVQAEPLASRGDISSNPRKQYANGEPGEREEPMTPNEGVGRRSWESWGTERRGRVCDRGSFAIKHSFSC